MSKLFGLDTSVLNQISTLLTQNLQSKKNYLVYVFGSRARGTHRQYSDLDLWIECDPPLTSAEKTNLDDIFEDSDLAITIDIVTPETCLKAYEPQIKNEMKLWFRLPSV